MQLQCGLSQMTKDKLVCTWAWRENEGDANKNYFVSLGSAAWIVQELYCFIEIK
jgi:hypothetical protein